MNRDDDRTSILGTENVCPICGHAYPEGATVCEHCGGKRPQDEPPRWGTAHFYPNWFLEIRVRGSDELIVVRPDKELMLGRYDTINDRSPDLPLDGYGAAEKGVSRQHAVIRRQKDCLLLVDLGSTNATYLNGQRLIPHQPRMLRDGDELRLGRLVMQINYRNAATT